MNQLTSTPELLGILAGIISCIIFLIYHQITISNIWFSSVAMLPISAVAGYLLIKSYLSLHDKFSHISWFLYNSYFIVALTLLSLVSVVIFTPEYTSGEILNLGGPPPSGLITAAFPLTVVWLILVAIAISVYKTHDFSKFFITLATSAILFLTLGLNLSILGKVKIEAQHQYLLEKFLAMNAGLGVIFAAVYSLLFTSNQID